MFTASHLKGPSCIYMYIYIYIYIYARFSYGSTYNITSLSIWFSLSQRILSRVLLICLLMDWSNPRCVLIACTCTYINLKHLNIYAHGDMDIPPPPITPMLMCIFNSLKMGCICHSIFVLFFFQRGLLRAANLVQPQNGTMMAPKKRNFKQQKKRNLLNETYNHRRHTSNAEMSIPHIFILGPTVYSVFTSTGRYFVVILLLVISAFHSLWE